jgi:hypothetical protein
MRQHKKWIILALLALGVAGTYLSGAVTLEEAMRQVGALISSTTEVK